VREYWIIAIEAKTTYIHRLSGGGYGAAEPVAFDAPLSLPGIAEPLIIRDVLLPR
jgi:hypothetical protein